MSLFKRQVHFGYKTEGNFFLLDGPGTQAATDIMKHAILQRALLTTYPLNAIAVTVKIDTRIDSMVTDYENSIEFLKKRD